MPYIKQVLPMEDLFTAIGAAFTVLFMRKRNRPALAEVNGAETALPETENSLLTSGEVEAVRGLLQDKQNGRPHPLPDTLTAAERNVAQALLDGLSRKEISAKLFITTTTVNFHIGNIFRKCDCSSVHDFKKLKLLAATYTDSTELTAEIVKKLIERIEIKRAEIIDGKEVRELNIIYRFINTTL